MQQTQPNSEVLRHAAKCVLARGSRTDSAMGGAWLSREYPERQLCLEGGLQCALGALPPEQPDADADALVDEYYESEEYLAYDRDNEHYWSEFRETPAYHAVERYLDENYWPQVIERFKSKGLSYSGMNTLPYRWNDEAGRTLGDVADLLNTVADLEEAKENA